MGTTDGNSSSEDETHYQPRIQLPTLKKNRRSVRFPASGGGSKSNRNLAMMFISDSNQSSGDEIDDSVDPLRSGGGGLGSMPSFGGQSMAARNDEMYQDSESENSMGSQNPFMRAERQAELEYSSDSDEGHTMQGSGAGGVGVGSNRRMPSMEADITEQPRSLVSNNADSNPLGIRGILRKMSLADKFGASNETSNSDTFIGRMMSVGGGLGSGGLAPGASHMGEGPEPTDAEKAVGFEDSDAIELKKLEPSQLNDEAFHLISAHVPSIKRKSEHNQAQGEGEGEKSNPFETASSMTGLGSDQFYIENPDIYLRNNESSDDEDFRLDEGDDYVAPPKHVQAGVLSSLLKLYQHPQASKSSSSFNSRWSTLAEDHSDISRPASTSDMLKKFGFSNKKKKGTTTPTKAETSSDDVQDNPANTEEGAHLASFRNAVPKAPKKFMSEAGGPTNAAAKNIKKLKNIRRNHQDRNAKKITVHIEKVLYRQRFIVKMCKALMLYGAPTHRLEEYMTMTSRVLAIDGQFIYFPGCMMISFGDAATRTSEVHLVRCAQGLNLYKLSQTHKVYKEVIHDLTGVEDASQKLDELMKTRSLYAPWICVILYGLGSAAVCPWAFGGGWLDLPVAFGIGLCVGYLQFFVSSISNLYSSVFEVSASIVVSFIARGIGSINNSNTFCFGALVQSCLALILPGYIILCGSLELQSRNIVAGSVRMFYAIIYSLFLGFGITLGAALYGWIDKGATNVTVCPESHQLDSKWRILFVPLFTACLGLINQAEWKQLPVMIFISSTAYIATFFAGKHFLSVTEFTACIGAFIIGVLGNLYSRIGKGMAVSAMLPAIFVQVPSGIALQSSLLAGVQSANKITHSNSTTLTGTPSNSLSFGVTMVEVAIGISVGLFAAALCVYPLGKKKTGLFAL